MPLTIRLTPEEESLLEQACQRSVRSKSDIVRQGVREVCSRIVRGDKTPYELGADLFGAGDLAKPLADKTSMTSLNQWCKDNPKAKEALVHLFEGQHRFSSRQDFRTLERTFSVCEQAWIRNLDRLQGKRIRYLLVAEAAPWVDLGKPIRYFYESPEGPWAMKVLKAFDLMPPKNRDETNERLSALADRGFVLVDTLPFAAPYTSRLRSRPIYLELVRRCRPFFESKLADLTWGKEVKLAFAFKLNGSRIMDAYDQSITLPNGSEIRISESQIAADRSGYTNVEKLQSLFGL